MSDSTAVLDKPGKEILYLPIRLHQSSSDKLKPEEFPFSSSDCIKGPLPDPIHSNGIEYPAGLQNKRLHRAPISTRPSSTTKTAHKVKILKTEVQLQDMRRSSTLWDNLKAYGNSGLDMGQNADQSLFREDLDEKRYFSTWTARGGRAGPPASQQVNAVSALSAWLGTQMNRPEPVVNCEEAVQDEIQQQLMQPLGYILQTRYCNTVMDPLRGTRPEQTWHHEPPPKDTKEADNNPSTSDDEEEEGDNDDGKTHPSNAANSSRGAPPGAFMPFWGRSTHAAHKHAGKKFPAHHKGGLAGFPDYLFIASASHQDHGGIGEGKTSWGVPDDLLEERLFDSYLAPYGTFKWSDKSQAAKVVRQIWGELEFFSSHWGFFTNGSKILVFVKSQDNELTFSEIQDWEQDDVLQAFAGLSFAAYDTMHLLTNHNLNLIDILCPVDDRVVNW